ncbi:multidrug efflux SMR transporter [Sphingomonas sp. BK235]|uniref:DMT family transporter n=1 Tax=Sphingomonas sp. BK235 TaxID=2512131 RepID=UPI0010451474|nr:multidrug efflux SMR transporter [Sphingomonas sp. BK235]TCP35430.1 small multidrug resistance pump [Sphingomonas sp. BK235]
MARLLLLVAILAEVTATTALKASDGLTRPLPSLVTALGYGIAFYCLSLALRHIATGVAYAIWSGVGIVLVTALAWWLHGQKLDGYALGGMALIVAGVLLVNLSPAAAQP